MKKIKKTWPIWLLSVIITIAAVFYQRITGPTYPIDVEFKMDETTYSFDLPRSNNGRPVCKISIELPAPFEVSMNYRKYPTNEDWTRSDFTRDGDILLDTLPNLPAAGKYEYNIEIYNAGQKVELEALNENIVIRFRNDVPAWAILPHVLLIFLAMLWSNAAGILAATGRKYMKHIYITIGVYFIAGLVFGPIVQKYSFGAFWTGWPVGEDLTDTKVLVSFLFWLAALVLNLKKERRWAVISAALIMFIIFLIPHSMRGSELDHESGEVITAQAITKPEIIKQL